METYYRTGTFFIIVGLALLLLFIVSILVGDIHGVYLLLSFASLVLGFLFRRNKPVNESGRFGTLRRIREYNRRHREEEMNNRRQRGKSADRRRRRPGSGRENEEENRGEDSSNE